MQFCPLGISFHCSNRGENYFSVNKPESDRLNIDFFSAASNLISKFCYFGQQNYFFDQQFAYFFDQQNYFFDQHDY